MSRSKTFTLSRLSRYHVCSNKKWTEETNDMKKKHTKQYWSNVGGWYRYLLQLKLRNQQNWLFYNIFLSPWKKKNVHIKSLEEKAVVYLSVCLWMEKTEMFTFENIWVWLDKLFEIFISDEPIKKGKIYTKNKLLWLVFTLVF